MSSSSVHSSQAVHWFDLSRVVELPFELRLMILEAAANIDLRTAIAISQVDRRCNTFSKGSKSGFHEIVKIDGLQGLLNVIRGLRSGAIDGGRVKGVFLVNVRGDGFASKEECEASCEAIEDVYRESEKLNTNDTSRGNEDLADCIGSLAVDELLSKCRSISALHVWEPTSALSMPG